MEKENVKSNVLALDCATTTGWAVAVEGRLAEYGEIRLKAGECDLWAFLTEITAKYGITHIVAEGAFYDEKKKNIKTFERLSNFHGVMHLFSQLNGLKFTSEGYQPTQWKRTLTCNAYATKEQVKDYVNNMLRRLDPRHQNIQSDNITDAIGIYLAWWKRQLLR